MKSWVKATFAFVGIVAGVGAWVSLSEGSAAEPSPDEGAYRVESHSFAGDVDVSDIAAGQDPSTAPGHLPPVEGAADPTEETAQAAAEELARRGETYEVDASDLPVGDPADVLDEESGR